MPQFCQKRPCKNENDGKADDGHARHHGQRGGFMEDRNAHAHGGERLHDAQNGGHGRAYALYGQHEGKVGEGRGDDGEKHGEPGFRRGVQPLKGAGGEGVDEGGEHTEEKHPEGDAETGNAAYARHMQAADVDGVAPFDFGGGDDMADMDDIDVDVSGADFGSSVLNNLKKITIPGILVGSAVEGCINALMTLRIGYVTRTYLLEGSKALSGTKCKRKVKRQAIKDSIRTMPEIISEGSVVIGKTMADALKRAF